MRDKTRIYLVQGQKAKAKRPRKGGRGHVRRARRLCAQSKRSCARPDAGEEVAKHSGWGLSSAVGFYAPRGFHDRNPMDAGQ